MSRPRSASGAVEVVWPGKYGPDGARVEVPARTLGLRVEQVIGGGEAEPTRASGLLVGGDNLLVMDALMATHAGAIDLVYIDPPFATGHEFERTTRVGADAEGPELRSRAYSDRWPGGVAGLLQMLDPRLRRIHRLLAPHGSLYVHVDPIVGHAVKLLLDEIFGPGCFQREIVWRVGWVSGFKARANNWIRNHDLIYFYVKDPQRFVFHRQVNPHPEEYRRRKGEADQQGGVPVEDVWNASPAEWRLRGVDSLDSIQIKSFSREKTGWATQKNESLLRRIVAASSDPGALVADFFCGAGTTLAAAQALGRRWIGCDSAAAAIELAHARMAEKTGSQFVRAGLGAEERQIWLSGQAEPWPAAVLRLRGARAVEGPLSGVVGDTAVWVGPPDRAVTEAELSAAAAAAAELGLRRLEVLAWAWAFPAGSELARGTGVSVVCLQLRRALLDPRGNTGELPWSERPVVEVTFALAATKAGYRARATLVGARFSAPTRATAALEATGDARAAVEAWSLAFGGCDGASQAAGEQGTSLAASVGEEPLPGVTGEATAETSARRSGEARGCGSEASAGTASGASVAGGSQASAETAASRVGESEARVGSASGASPAEASAETASRASESAEPATVASLAGGSEASAAAASGSSLAGGSEASAGTVNASLAGESDAGAQTEAQASLGSEASAETARGESPADARGESVPAASSSGADGREVITRVVRVGAASSAVVGGEASSAASGNRPGASGGAGGMAPHRPAFAAARTRSRRELDADSGWIELEGAGPWTASVRVVDVLGGESWHIWRIEYVR
ncbi:DNA methyltransferase [Nannocystis sp. ILAH1]|uniref:DNA methyltransferase n=1 Tax=Nannocystis sp. ILAH1 TaxID=2996789 RepID=UPI0022722DBB|nr:DNA methyltransferase [Nannocystis sp. ILAH1]MCY0987404.1 DNA methyltransferase [Nannocystis sp. ILAH1]